MDDQLPDKWEAILFGGPYDGAQLDIDTIWPRIKIWPTFEHREVAEYRRIDYDLEAATAAYLINEDELMSTADLRLAIARAYEALEGGDDPPDTVAAQLWLRTTFPLDHPNYIDAKEVERLINARRAPK